MSQKEKCDDFKKLEERGCFRLKYYGWFLEYKDTCEAGRFKIYYCPFCGAKLT